MLYTSSVDPMKPNANLSATIKSRFMEIYPLNFSNIGCKTAVLLTILFILSGCNPHEDSLASREAAVSAREAELVTLFAELSKEKKQLAHENADQLNEKNTAKDESEQAVDNKTTVAEKPKNSRIILGALENIYLDPPGMEFSARIDTGAQTSSLNALDMVKFERDGKPYVKFHVVNPKTGEKIELTRRIRSHVRIKDFEEDARRRPVIRLHVKLASIDERIDFTLVDRSKFKQQVLIGRNFLRDLAIVDVSQEFMIPSIENTDVDITNAN
ncbi:MAG: RimK/LysX family protein [Nitrosomonas sp.]|nr:RimK/LysX family protein [Nitrosomonas sp.]MDP1950370.1 RimK/LysX family protein [Nitrosomonas sp.]